MIHVFMRTQHGTTFWSNTSASKPAHVHAHKLTCTHTHISIRSKRSTDPRTHAHNTWDIEQYKTHTLHIPVHVLLLVQICTYIYMHNFWEWCEEGRTWSFRNGRLTMIQHLVIICLQYSPVVESGASLATVLVTSYTHVYENRLTQQPFLSKKEESTVCFVAVTLADTLLTGRTTCW